MTLAILLLSMNVVTALLARPMTRASAVSARLRERGKFPYGGPL
jgi:hypothetical protein